MSDLLDPQYEYEEGEQQAGVSDNSISSDSSALHSQIALSDRQLVLSNPLKQLAEIKRQIRIQRDIKAELQRENALLRQQSEDLIHRSESNSLESSLAALTAPTEQFQAASAILTQNAKFDLLQMKQLLYNNKTKFDDSIDQICSALSGKLGDQSRALGETQELVEDAENVTRIDEICKKAPDNVFPGRDGVERLNSQFTGRQRQILEELATDGEIGDFIAEVCTYLECNRAELRQNWSPEVENYVKEGAIQKFCVEPGPAGSRGGQCLYFSDQDDELEVAWLMLLVFRELQRGE